MGDDKGALRELSAAPIEQEMDEGGRILLASDSVIGVPENWRPD
jgi:hypothetical protein